MQPDALEAAQEWMEHAERDLLAADKLLTNAPVLPGPAAFNTQQAAEKALRAFLTAWGETFANTYNQSRLLEACVSIEPSFQRFTTHVLALSPLVAEYRYPGSSIDPDEPRIRAALTLAREVVEHVRELLAQSLKTSFPAVE